MAQEIQKMSIRRFVFLTILTLCFLLLIFIISLSIGSSMLLINDVFLCITRIHCNKTIELIIMYRFTRTAIAMLVGALLAMSGTLIQSIARNPLAEPYILGLSSTALTVIAIAIIINPSIIAMRPLLMILSFVGAFTGYILTTTISVLAKGTSISLILSGIAVTTLFSGFSHILLYIVQSKLRSPYHLLLMGSTTISLINDVYILLTILASGIVIIYLAGLPKKLNAYVFGDEFAKQLGYNPKRLSIFTALLVSILTGSCVAIVGIIGFIGLVAPHMARLLLSTSDHRVTVILSIIIGSILTTLADIISRVLAITTAHGEFPLSSITSIIGGPFFVYLIIKSGRR